MMKIRMQVGQCWVIALGMLVACMSVSVVAQETTQETTQNAIVDGQELYKNYCSVCHGDLGDGMTRARRGLNPPPRDFTTKLAKVELSDERMLDSVSHGRPGTAMMSFSSRLSAQEIKAVVGYIKDSFMLQGEVKLDENMVALARGKILYVSNCAVCHGDDSAGSMWTKTSLNPPPRDFTTLKSMEELSRARMIASVTHGRPGTAMMSFSHNLTPSDVETVVDYVRKEFIGRVAQVQTEGAAVPSGHPRAASPHGQAQAAVPAPPVRLPDADMNQGFAGGLVGQAEWGETFFMSNCRTCHGEKGDGDGPRAKFIRPKPRNFLSEESRRLMNRPALYRAIALGKQGTVMPSWDKVLTAQEIANVAEFVFTRFIEVRVPEPEDVSLSEGDGKREGEREGDSEKKKASS